MNGVRVAITVFVAALLALIALGWVWTSSHQTPALSTASHVVLGIAGLSGIGALVKIWSNGRPRVGARR
jgi:hypothetical protein